MNFEKDIFISYAHIDDEALIEGEKGWISEFHRALEVRLSQLMGERPIIWRDTELEGNHNYNDEIISQFSKIALLVSIITPRYVKSKWCVKEVKEFKKASDKNIGVQVNNKSRIFKVIKTPVNIHDHPIDIQGVLGYEFYQLDNETNRVKEFSKVFGEENQQLYWSKLDDIAHDICGLLQELKSDDPNKANSSAVPKGPSVYLAETSFDKKEDRDKIKRWLIDNGNRVFPDQNLPLVANEYEADVKELISNCDLSIHMLGATYGLVPEGTENSKTVIQNSIAADLSLEKGLKRIIWAPPGLEGNDDRQITFLENIGDSIGQEETDYIIGPLEDLKFAIKDKLEKKVEELISVEENEEVTEDDSLPAQVYLICDQRDLDNIIPIEDYFFDQGFEVVLPAFEGEQSELRLDHQENLKNCDAVVIYYGAGNDLWVRSKTRDLMKIAGYGRKKPLGVKAIILTSPETPQKKRFRSHDLTVINALEGFDASLLQEVVVKIKSLKS